MNSDIDIDQNLLLQFSCMGTTDKDELIKQLQTLLGYQLNQTTASFFLEMNNWNLQGAVGSYFDSYYALKLPSMTILRDTSMTEETRVHPGTTFYKCWDVQNSSDEPWPPGCSLQFTSGSMMTNQSSLPVPSVPPWSQGTIRLDMVAPDQPGIYQSKWRLSTSTGSYFGDVIWVIVTVLDQSLDGLTQQFSSSLSTVSMDTTSSSQPKSQNDIHQRSLDDDGNMIC